MRVILYRFIQSLLCLVAGALLSVIELGFFPGIGFISLPFLVISIVTVAAVFLYVRSVNSFVFIFIYTVCLHFVLEISGNSVDIMVFLACMLVLALLFAHARHLQNAVRFRIKKPAHSVNLLTVLVCISIVAVSSSLIYTYVLQPQLSGNEENALPDIIEKIDEPDTTPPPLSTEQNIQADSDGLYTITPLRPPREPDVLRWVLIACAAFICVLAVFFMYKYRKYRSWVRKTLSAPPSIQIYEFYMYFLRSLAICGFPRRVGETPFDYLCNLESDKFPLPTDNFREITDAFAASQFGRKTVPPLVSENCLSLFSLLPGLVKEKMGRKFYFLHYIRKMHVNRVESGERREAS